MHSGSDRPTQADSAAAASCERVPLLLLLLATRWRRGYAPLRLRGFDEAHITQLSGGRPVRGVVRCAVSGFIGEDGVVLGRPQLSQDLRERRPLIRFGRHAPPRQALRGSRSNGQRKWPSRGAHERLGVDLEHSGVHPKRQ